MSWSHIPSGSALLSLNFSKENVLIFLSPIYHSTIPMWVLHLQVALLYIMFLELLAPFGSGSHFLPSASVRQHSPGFSLLLPFLCFLSSFSSTLPVNAILRAESHALFSDLSSFLPRSSTKTENYPGHFHLYHDSSYYLYR